MRQLQWFQLAQSILIDCISSRLHSRDFDFYRSELLLVRARLFAALFGIATPAWIPFDRWLLPTETLTPMMGLRAVTGLVLLLLAVLPARPSLAVARFRVSVLVLITLVFYLVVQSMAGPTFHTPALIGYTALPLLMVAILALLPLTLLESSLLQSVIGLTVFLLHLNTGTLGNEGVLGLLWILLLFIGFALMAQGIQLHLLLMIHRQATRDNLTGLFNRGALLRHARQIITNGEQSSQPYAVLMIDLDRFKQINDTYGHLIGDRVLREVAGIIQRDLSPDMLPGRFGGEEFILLIADCRMDEAMQKAEKIRQEVSELIIDTEQGPIALTTSVGVAQGEPHEEAENVIHRADLALYSAKEKGRNLVISD